MTVHDARERRFGRYFDEFEVGDVYRHWPGHTITEAEDHLFCMLTMATSPVHVDAHYASTEMEGGRNMVVGTYVYSLLLGMSVPDTSGKAIAALGTESLRHVAPMYHGDTLYGETSVLEKRVSDAFTRGDHREGTRAATLLEHHRARLDELYARWIAAEEPS